MINLAPHIHPLGVGDLGESHALCTMSPTPSKLSAPSTPVPLETRGMIVREMIFHSSFKSIGITG